VKGINMADNSMEFDSAVDIDAVNSFFEKRVQWLLSNKTADTSLTAETYVAAYDIFSKLPADCKGRFFRAIVLPVDADLGTDQTKRHLAKVYASAYLIALQDSRIITSKEYKSLFQFYHWNVALNALKVV
jgi:hypothetical protein